MLEDFNRRRVSPDDDSENPLANIEVTPRELTFKNGAPVPPRSNAIANLALGLVALTFGAGITLALMLGAGFRLKTDVRPDVSSRPPAAFGIFENSADRTATEPLRDFQNSPSLDGADSLDPQYLPKHDWVEGVTSRSTLHIQSTASYGSFGNRDYVSRTLNLTVLQ